MQTLSVTPTTSSQISSSIFTDSKSEKQVLEELEKAPADETEDQRSTRLFKRKVLLQSTQESIRTFRSDMQLLFDSAQMVDNSWSGDVEIQVQDVSFRAHKLILWTRCEFFRQHLSEDCQVFLVQQILDTTLQTKIIVNPLIFKTILYYLYSGDLQLTNENIFDVFELATLLHLSHAEQLCAWFLKISTDPSSVCTLLLSALKKGDDKFISICTKVIESNMEKVIQDPIFLLLPKSVVLQLAQSETMNCSEKQLFDALMKWQQSFVEKNNLSPENQKELLDELFQFVRFPLMDPQELKQVEETHLINDEYLLEAYRFVATDTLCAFYEPSAKQNEVIRYFASPRSVPRKTFNVATSWIFDQNAKHANITISNHGLTVTLSNTGGHSSVLGNIGFKNGVIRWRVKVEGTQSHWIGVGVCNKENVSTYVNDYSHFVGCSSANQKYKTQGTLTQWNVGEEFICVLDLVKGVFTINGMGTSLASTEIMKGKTWYPIINLYNVGNTVTVKRLE